MKLTMSFVWDDRFQRTIVSQYFHQWSATAKLCRVQRRKVLGMFMSRGKRSLLHTTFRRWHAAVSKAQANAERVEVVRISLGTLEESLSTLRDERTKLRDELMQAETDHVAKQQGSTETSLKLDASTIDRVWVWYRSLAS